MEYDYPKFTPEMKKTPSILIPNMAITQFRLLSTPWLRRLQVRNSGNCGSAIAQLGTKSSPTTPATRLCWSSVSFWTR